MPVAVCRVDCCRTKLCSHSIKCNTRLCKSGGMWLLANRNAVKTNMLDFGRNAVKVVGTKRRLRSGTQLRGHENRGQLQGSLLWTARKACLERKEALFGRQRRLPWKRGNMALKRTGNTTVKRGRTTGFAEKPPGGGNATAQKSARALPPMRRQGPCALRQVPGGGHSRSMWLTSTFSCRNMRAVSLKRSSLSVVR